MRRGGFKETSSRGPSTPCYFAQQMVNDDRIFKIWTAPLNHAC
jgi:hypothetical protein